LAPIPAVEQSQPTMLISPTEPVKLRAVGTTSPVPERYGADVLFDAPPVGLIGVQRKTVPDLFASVRDGRLTRGIGAMAALDVALLIIEGDLRWTVEGAAEPDDAGARPATSWSREAYRSLLWSVRARGVWVETTPDLAATIQIVMSLRKWASKDVHEALDRRGRPRPGGAADGDALHILQGLAGIGPRTAARILDHFGALPLTWSVSEDELAAVPGIGKVRARRLWTLLRAGDAG
jgi:ERCC4-type nuclease